MKMKGQKILDKVEWLDFAWIVDSFALCFLHFLSVFFFLFFPSLGSKMDVDGV
jgi:hypothetical protein